MIFFFLAAALDLGPVVWLVAVPPALFTVAIIVTWCGACLS